MPMIDVYAPRGTFDDKHTLAQDRAKAVMRWEQVPEIPLFLDNTAALHRIATRPHRTMKERRADLFWTSHSGCPPAFESSWRLLLGSAREDERGRLRGSVTGSSPANPRVRETRTS
jgi:hypothetical protein